MIKVCIGNVFILISGIATGFILPKVLGLTNYGYYKVFTLYCSYISILHFGFVDGIYLLYGDIGNKGMDKEKFIKITSNLFYIEILVSIVCLILSITLFSDNYRMVFCFVSLNIVCINCTTYYQVLSQITQNFEELKARNIIKSILLIFASVILFIVYLCTRKYISYTIYLLIFTGIGYFLLLWYIITYKNIFQFQKIKDFFDVRKEVFEICKIGLPLTLSNLFNVIILSVDRQFVNVLFSTDQFAIYSFAYSLLTIITTIITSISTVLYPYLKTNLKMMQNNVFEKISLIVVVLSSLFTLCYYPLYLIIKNMLPDYILGCNVLLIMIPTISLSSIISIVCHNFYKTLNRSRQYFDFSVLALVISIIMNVLFYFLFKTMYAIAIASLITIFIWLLIVDITLFLGKKRNVFLMIIRYMYIIILNCFFIIFMTKVNIVKYIVYIFINIIMTFVYYIFYKKNRKEG